MDGIVRNVQPNPPPAVVHNEGPDRRGPWPNHRPEDACRWAAGPHARPTLREPEKQSEPPRPRQPIQLTALLHSSERVFPEAVMLPTRPRLFSGSRLSPRWARSMVVVLPLLAAAWAGNAPLRAQSAPSVVLG